jgi:hypothetical protein
LDFAEQAMTRAATGDTVVVKASSNIYTVLVIAATIVTALALAVVWMRAQSLGYNFF